MTPEQFGNLHYGYVGAAYGFGIHLLHLGSMKAHLKDAGLKGGLSSMGMRNELSDWRMVDKGFYLFMQYGGRVGRPVDRYVR